MLNSKYIRHAGKCGRLRAIFTAHSPAVVSLTGVNENCQ